MQSIFTELKRSFSFVFLDTWNYICSFSYRCIQGFLTLFYAHNNFESPKIIQTQLQVPAQCLWYTKYKPDQKIGIETNDQSSNQRDNGVQKKEASAFCKERKAEGLRMHLQRSFIQSAALIITQETLILYNAISVYGTPSKRQHSIDQAAKPEERLMTYSFYAICSVQNFKTRNCEKKRTFAVQRFQANLISSWYPLEADWLCHNAHFQGHDTAKDTTLQLLDR